MSTATVSKVDATPAEAPTAAVDELVEPVEPVVAVPTEPELQLQPQPHPQPQPYSAPEPYAEAESVLAASPPDSERCSQCGAPLSDADIFCGECGFVRQAAGSPRPRDTVALDPFPWGLPAALEEASTASPQFDPDVEQTRIVDRSARGARFVLQFSTGESVSVSGTGLLGRNPVAEPGEYFDDLVTISDPGKSVSKTHLEFGQDGGAFWVSDRFSGNGTVVREPDSQPKRCDSGKRYRIARGTRVEIGEQFFIVS